MDERIVPLSEAKVHFHELVRGLPERTTILVRHGRPVGVMLDFEGHQGLLARVEDLEDRLSVFEARREAPDMRVPWEKLKAESGLAAE